MKKLLFYETKWTVNIFSYEEGGLGIILTRRVPHSTLAEDMYDDMVISAWEPGLADDEIAIKDFAENKGALETLVKADIVYEPHRFIYAEYTYGVAELSVVRLKKPMIKGKENETSNSKQNFKYKANLAKPAAKN
jgi:hypothetical protein